MIVPSIRQDLKLSEGPKKEDGSASWLLYDSLRNKYFSINKKAFDLLKNWSSGIETTEFIEKTNNKKLSSVFNLLGQKNISTKNTLLLYKYDDGSVEKKLIVK